MHLGARGRGGHGGVGAVLGADELRDADPGVVRAAVPDRRGSGALHRGALHLAGRPPGGVARAGVCGG